MSQTRVEVVGAEEFNPREWLRREVLWASLMTPYGKQLAGWTDRDITAVHQHNSNVSRAQLYAQDESAESQALAFFNQGKNIGGILSSASLFRACMERREGRPTEPLKAQATSVDKALAHRNTTPIISDESAVYVESGRMISRVNISPPGTYGTNVRLLRAAKIMTSYAAVEINEWLNFAEQPGTPLTIQNGGHPRSAGPRVEMLQPLFEQILASEPYADLNGSV